LLPVDRQVRDDMPRCGRLMPAMIVYLGCTQLMPPPSSFTRNAMPYSSFMLSQQFELTQQISQNAVSFVLVTLYQL